MSDTENKGPKWHLKTREPIQGIDLERVTYCQCFDSNIRYIVVKDNPSLQPAKNKGTKSKPK